MTNDLNPIDLRPELAVFRWRPACWLRITGDDAADFLQGQFTNDLRALAKGGAVYGLWLTLKGKVLADSFILRHPSEQGFWIGSYHAAASVIRERLESHIIADDVLVEDVTEAWAGITLLGERAAAILNTPIDGAGAVFGGRRLRGLNVECVYPVALGAPAAIAAVMGSAPEIDRETMERRRIASGIPAIPADVGPADLPNEAGLEAEAISYTKGCYLGQEVMARLKSMGQVRRRLLRVQGKGAAFPPVPAPVFAGLRQVGTLRSAIGDEAGGWIGLAMITVMHVSTGAALSFSGGESPALRLVDPL